MIRKFVFALATGALIMVSASPAGAVHFYRGPDAGCTPAEGSLGDPLDDGVEADAEVMMLHNTFNDAASGAPLTVIQAGESIRWTWNSEHCHSVTAAEEAFDSGFHYPAPTPDTPEAVPGLFHYPVPTFEETSLTYTRTFAEPGAYLYSCVHHAAIGMVGVVVVE